MWVDLVLLETECHTDACALIRIKICSDLSIPLQQQWQREVDDVCPTECVSRRLMGAPGDERSTVSGRKHKASFGCILFL